MATNDDLLDAAIVRALRIERLKGGVWRDLRKLLKTVEKRLADRIAAGTGTTVQSRRTKALLKEVIEIIAGGADKFGERLGIVGADLAVIEAENARRDFVTNVPIRYEFTVPAAATLEAVAATQPFQGAILKDWVSEWSQATVAKVSRQIRMGIIEGEPVETIVRRLIGTKANDYADGILETSRRSARTIVRTYVNHVSTAAREATYESNADVLQGVLWVSVLDSRTSFVCFVGSTNVTPLGATLKAFRRVYDGDVISIATAAGKQLTGTPNHPILTARGWLALHELKPSDKVVSPKIDNIVGGVENGDVTVQAEIAAIFDAFSKPSGFSVFNRCSAQADFHGDGMGGDYQVDVAAANGELGSAFEAIESQQVKDTLLAGIHLAAALNAGGAPLKNLIVRSPTVKTAKIAPGALEDLIKPTFGPAFGEPRINLRRANPVVEQRDSGLAVRENGVVADTARARLHEVVSFEESGDGRCGNAVISTDTGGRLAIEIFFDDIISVRRELHFGHVYNLETSEGCYIANGIIVKNCASRDGNIYPIGEGPRPPAHPNCRSTTTPIIKGRDALIEAGLIPKSTRASIDGQLPDDLTFDGFLKKKGDAFAEEWLGPARFKLWKAGTPLDKFVNDDGRTLTLDELRGL